MVAVEKLVSIVIPCYNEQESLSLLIDELARVLVPQRTPPTASCGANVSYSFETILVDDGSTDETMAVIKSLSTKTYPFTLRYASLSRNFGKEAALWIGLSRANGDYVVTMDADLQDPPSLLPEMLRLVENGDYDSVAACRSSRKGEPPIRSFFSKLFYKAINALSDSDIVDGARDYRLMNRNMVNAVLSMGERNRFSKGIYGWVGFKTKWIDYENVERAAGTTKWSFLSLAGYAIEGIVDFSAKPLQIASGIGLILFVCAVLLGIFIFIRALLFGDPVSGWPSLACLVLFIGSIQLLCTGITGQYLSRTYLETKNRPICFVRESSEDL